MSVKSKAKLWLSAILLFFFTADDIVLIMTCETDLLDFFVTPFSLNYFTVATKEISAASPHKILEMKVNISL